MVEERRALRPLSRVVTVIVWRRGREAVDTVIGASPDARAPARARYFVKTRAGRGGVDGPRQSI